MQKKIFFFVFRNPTQKKKPRRRKKIQTFSKTSQEKSKTLSQKTFQEKKQKENPKRFPKNFPRKFPRKSKLFQTFPKHPSLQEIFLAPKTYLLMEIFLDRPRF